MFVFANKHLMKFIVLSGLACPGECDLTVSLVKKPSDLKFRGFFFLRIKKTTAQGISTNRR